jgi:hypothetical protein
MIATQCQICEVPASSMSHRTPDSVMCGKISCMAASHTRCGTFIVQQVLLGLTLTPINYLSQQHGVCCRTGSGRRLH